MDRVKRHTKRVLVGIIGGIVTLLGVVLIPYPGPGWLVVFAGFAILATEFEFAARALEWLREKYDGWVNWLKAQNRLVQVAVLIFTAVIVLVTAYLLNTFGLINGALRLEQSWLISPFFK
jgi:uncharacterized protein (TIGR02611 family)